MTGFQNLFSEIVDLEDTYDLMVLKSGPGVGKATFMREIGRSMEEAGTPVEYLWCSGDPDSLDGVVLPELRCAVVDGTSPHVVEPRYPAAVDRYVDLGRFYDLTAAKAAAEEVKGSCPGLQGRIYPGLSPSEGCPAGGAGCSGGGAEDLRPGEGGPPDGGHSLTGAAPPGR